MAKNYMTLITTHQTKIQGLLQALTKAGMVSWTFKMLSYLALFVSCVAGLMAVLPMVIETCSSEIHVEVASSNMGKHN